MIEQQKDYKERYNCEGMAQTNFYFYNLTIDNKLGLQYNWKIELDKIIFFMLPRDKSEFSEEQIFKAIKDGFDNKKEKLI